MSENKSQPKIEEKDVIHLIRGAGHHMPEGFIDEVLEKAKEIDRQKELEKEKDKGRDMLDD
jgi:hypothetical protein